jgi:hypothetical protein
LCWMPPPHPSSRYALRAVAFQIARSVGSGGGLLRGTGNVVDQRP